MMKTYCQSTQENPDNSWYNDAVEWFNKLRRRHRGGGGGGDLLACVPFFGWTEKIWQLLQENHQHWSHAEIWATCARHGMTFTPQWGRQKHSADSMDCWARGVCGGVFWSKIPPSIYRLLKLSFVMIKVQRAFKRKYILSIIIRHLLACFIQSIKAVEMNVCSSYTSGKWQNVWNAKLHLEAIKSDLKCNLNLAYIYLTCLIFCPSDCMITFVLNMSLLLKQRVKLPMKWLSKGLLTPALWLLHLKKDIFKMSLTQAWAILDKPSDITGRYSHCSSTLRTKLKTTIQMYEILQGPLWYSRVIQLLLQFLD